MNLAHDLPGRQAKTQGGEVEPSAMRNDKPTPPVLQALARARRALVMMAAAAVVVAGGLAVASRERAQSQGAPAAANPNREAQPAAKGAPSPVEAAKTGTAPAAQAKGPPPPVVTTSQPLVREIVEWDEYTGRFEAVASVDIRARVSGYLDRVAFTDGQKVTKGDLLFEIDPRPFQRILAQAQAELEQARTKARNASLDVERGRPLVERKIMSEKVFDDRSALLREAEAAVRVAEAKVATAELDVAFTRILAPIDGRIGRALVSPGAWISAGGAANATVLSVIVAQDPIHVYFDVTENNLIKYKRLAERGEMSDARMIESVVEVALPDEATFPHRGRLDFLDNRLDSGTATIRARAVLANEAAMFSPGMFARVRLAGTPLRPTVLLPDAAILTDQANKYVLVVDESGTVGRRNVQLGPLHEGMRIVREGVKGDDWVVVNGLQRARPGQRVAAKREPLRLSAGQPASTAGRGAAVR